MVTVLAPEGAGAQYLIDALPPVPGVTVDVRSVPRSTAPFAEVYELADAAGRALGEGAEGVVVLRGTDTVEETAWALELLHAQDVPVVLAADPGRPSDLAEAIRVAAAGPRGLGCLLVAHGEIHAARHARRTGGIAAPAFVSPPAGPMGLVTDEAVRLLWRPLGRFTVRGQSSGRSPRIGLHTAALGDDGELLRIMAPHCDGLVVTPSGARGVPEPLASVLAEPAGRIPVVLTSCTARDGALPATSLDPLKARVLMYLLLDAGRDREAVLEAFAAVDRGDGGQL